MIFALVRLAVVWLVVLTLFYFLLSVYSRSLRKEKLEKQWEAQGLMGDREAYIREGLARYDSSLRPKLLWGVYIIPSVVAAVVFYFINLD